MGAREFGVDPLSSNIGACQNLWNQVSDPHSVTVQMCPQRSFSETNPTVVHPECSNQGGTQRYNWWGIHGFRFRKVLGSTPTTGYSKWRFSLFLFVTHTHTHTIIFRVGPNRLRLHDLSLPLSLREPNAINKIQIRMEECGWKWGWMLHTIAFYVVLLLKEILGYNLICATTFSVH